MASIECEYCEGEGVMELTKSGYYGEGITPFVDIYEVECMWCEGSGLVEAHLQSAQGPLESPFSGCFQ